MRISNLIGAGALVVATLTAATPAEAQRGGWRGDDRGGWHDGDRRDGYRDGYRDRRWRDGRGQREWRGGYRARARTVCRVQRGYYGPVRRCFRVWR